MHLSSSKSCHVKLLSKVKLSQLRCRLSYLTIRPCDTSGTSVTMTEVDIVARLWLGIRRVWVVCCLSGCMFRWVGYGVFC